VHAFANWLVTTPPSIALASASWVVPTMQIIHIVAIAVLFSAVLMVGLRVMGWAGQRQTLQATIGRYRPWFWCALAVLAATGTVLIVAEPPRELLSISFWLKMAALAVAVTIALLFLRSIDRRALYWEGAVQSRTRVLGIISFGVWCLVVFLGRFIAYDEQIWGGLAALH
jgi:uncharacterized protein DUF6644